MGIVNVGGGAGKPGIGGMFSARIDVTCQRRELFEIMHIPTEGRSQKLTKVEDVTAVLKGAVEVNIVGGWGIGAQVNRDRVVSGEAEVGKIIFEGEVIAMSDHRSVDGLYGGAMLVDDDLATFEGRCSIDRREDESGESSCSESFHIGGRSAGIMSKSIGCGLSTKHRKASGNFNRFLVSQHYSLRCDW